MSSQYRRNVSQVEKMRVMLNRKQSQLCKTVSSPTSSKGRSSSARRSSATQADMTTALDAPPSSHLVKLSFSLQVGSIMKSPEICQQQVEMEAGIWSHLPPELVVKILIHLPVSSLLRFRTVCKGWRSVIQSSSFLESFSCVPSREQPWLFLCSAFNCPENSCAYNPTLNRWYSIPLTFLPPCMRFPVTAVGGCLLIRGGQSKVGILCICNPFTGTWRELPCMIRKRLNCVVGAVQDAASGSFKIVVAGGASAGHSNTYTDYECTTEVYDSRTDSWSITGNLPRDYTVKVTVWTSKTVSCGSTLYCLTSSRPCNIMAYSVELGEWSELRVPQPDHISAPFLLQREGRLVLAGGLGSPRTCHKVVLWELCRDSQWVEITRMPDNFFKKFFKEKASADLKCAGKKGLVYFFRDSHTQVVVCDLSRTPASWRWLPCCPLSFYLQRFSIKGLFVEPGLDSSIKGGC